MMKKCAFLLFLLFAFYATVGFSKNVTLAEAKVVAEMFVKQHSIDGYAVFSSSEVREGGVVLAYVFELRPQGYVVVSSSTALSPVPAYSFEGGFGDCTMSNTLFLMLVKNLSGQMKMAEKSENRLTKGNEAKWTQLEDQPKVDFQQWPSTGNGWLKTNWTQTAPFSNFCPIDPVSSQRSYTGCPATAMSQILNFHGTLNGTRFNDNDDYYHNYSGRQFYIDEDYALHGFPSFVDLNYYMDTLQAHWDFDAVLTDNDKAALNFACGVAAKQVYSSGGSGTYSVSQALDAYHRFGCATALLIEPDDTTLITHLMQNMKDTLPAHLAVVDAGWTTGHNVVVDGYNTDGYFHVNFGWGGSSNGWYLLPQEMPMDLTSFEGVVVDIMKEAVIGVPENVRECKNVRVFPDPCSEVVNISYELSSPGMMELKIWDIRGVMLFRETMCREESGTIVLDLSELKCGEGVLFYQISTANDRFVGKMIKILNN